MDAAGEFDRRDGLQQREERATEESRLLAGHNGDGRWIAKQVGGRAGFGRCATFLLLFGQRVGHRVARAGLGVRLDPGHGVPPCAGFGRVAGERVGDTIEGERIIHGKTPKSGILADVDGVPDRGDG